MTRLEKKAQAIRNRVKSRGRAARTNRGNASLAPVERAAKRFPRGGRAGTRGRGAA